MVSTNKVCITEKGCLYAVIPYTVYRKCVFICPRVTYRLHFRGLEEKIGPDWYSRPYSYVYMKSVYYSTAVK